MESSFQKIIAALVGVMFMFIIPVYIAFEKVDDISYSLVLKFTQSFVDNVREKGYISPEMYTDFMGKIYSTNNMYDVQIEHVKKRYDPAIYIYGTNGDVLHVLDYDKYIDTYNSSKKLEIDEGIYTDKNAKIDIQDPKIVILDDEKKSIVEEWTKEDIGETEKFEEDLYRNYITNLKEYDEEKIIFGTGKVYADRSELSRLDKVFDEDLYIDSDITIGEGIFVVKNPKNEPKDIMSYNNYINSYDNSYKMNINGISYDVFDGLKFTTNNIENIKAAMWTGNKEYKALTNEEKEQAEELYYQKIDDYKATGNQVLVLSKGEIYSYHSSPKYNKWTDTLANSINVSGTITINNPSTWRVKEIEFKDENVIALREGSEIVADEGGTFKRESITEIAGNISDKNTGKQYVYDDELVSAMLDKSDRITIQRAEVYSNDDVILSDDAKIVVRHISGYTDPEDINAYVENEPVYTEDVNSWIGNLEDYISLRNEYEDFNQVTIGGITYSIEGGYEITLTVPTKMFCIGQAESDRELNNNIPEYITEYEEHGELVFSREYYKTDLNVIYRELKLYDESGKQKYYFKENENPQAFKEYIEELEQSEKIVVEKLQYSLDELTIEYDKIEINYGQDERKVIEKTNNYFLNYVDGYYTNQRIVISDALAYDNVNVIHPEIKMLSSNDKVLYEYKRESSDSEEIFWWQYYSTKVEDAASINIIYKTTDVYVEREKMTISSIEDGTIEILDNQYISEDSSNKYYDYKNEFEENGTVTFESPKVLTKEEMEVTHPKVTISNRVTGQIIKEYTVGFDDENLLQDFDAKKEDYEDHVIVDNPITYEDGKNCIMTTGHVINEERITEKQIVDKLFAGTDITKAEFLADCLAGNVDLYDSLAYMNENSYVMNEGDEIIVTVKNKNQTIASVFYSMFTANVGNEEVAKIYVNYGGNIKNDGATLLSDENGSIYSETGRLFKFKGEPEEVTLTKGKYSIECWGASGGGYYNASDVYTGGKGAYSKIEVNVTDENKTVYVYVGGAGTLYSQDKPSNGGWNGGGNSYLGYGGGGASDVRLLKGDVDFENPDIPSLLTRIVVAAGGGGASKENGFGGDAGILTSKARNGSTSDSNTTYVGVGSSHTSLVTKNGYTSSNVLENGGIPDAELTYEYGNFGFGGRADYSGAGGGGAGIVGGSASHNKFAGGGGGTSYTYITDPSYRVEYNDSVNLFYEGIRNINILMWKEYNDILRNNNTLLELYNSETDTLKAKWENEGIFVWKGINVIAPKIWAGYAVGSIPNPLNYNGTSTLDGNIGNGYVRIKKID